MVAFVMPGYLRLMALLTSPSSLRVFFMSALSRLIMVEFCRAKEEVLVFDASCFSALGSSLMDFKAFLLSFWLCCPLGEAFAFAVNRSVIPGMKLRKRLR